MIPKSHENFKKILPNASYGPTIRQIGFVFSTWPQLRLPYVIARPEGPRQSLVLRASPAQRCSGLASFFQVPTSCHSRESGIQDPGFELALFFRPPKSGYFIIILSRISGYAHLGCRQIGFVLQKPFIPDPSTSLISVAPATASTPFGLDWLCFFNFLHLGFPGQRRATGIRIRHRSCRAWCF